MPLYRITLAYDGTAYQGWQIQPDAPTIQGTLQKSLEQISDQRVSVVGAGRTDAGVHAQGQVAHFQLKGAIPDQGLLKGLNSLLPADIRVLSVDRAPPGFHARYSARSKTYRYHLDLSPVASPFRSRFTLHYPHALNRGALAEAAEFFIGKRDFLSFCAASTTVKNTERQCTVSRLFQERSELIYEIAANGFLHHMVRNIVGTLLEVGRDKIEPRDIESLFQSKDRRLAGPTAPACGLHLVRVEY